MHDECSSIGRKNLNEPHYARYDDKEDAEAAAEVAYLESIGVPRSATVVELGAGTGQFALEAARVFERVVAVDPSSVMLRQLRAKAEAQSSAVEVVEAGFLTYEHVGAPPDLVYSRYALHHLPDFWKVVALERVRRLLAPGGRLRLWDVVYHFAPDQVDERIERWCATGSPVEGEWSRAEIEEHVRDEGSTFTWLLEPMFNRVGFEIAAAEHTDGGFGAKYLLIASSPNPTCR